MKFSNPREDASEAIPANEDEYRHVGSVDKHPGHTMFSFNTITKEIKPAVIEHRVASGYSGNQTLLSTVKKEKDCVYIQALNQKNFIKKLKKQGYL